MDRLTTRYSEIGWDLIEAREIGELAPEVLRGFDPELIIYGLVGVARAVLGVMDECGFRFSQDDIKRFHLEAHREEDARHGIYDDFRS